MKMNYVYELAKLHIFDITHKITYLLHFNYKIPYFLLKKHNYSEKT